MKKACLVLFFILAAFGTLFAENHSIGLACIDIDHLGSSRPVVYQLTEGSPSAGKGGLQFGDLLLSINGQSLTDVKWIDAIPLLKSTSPTTFKFVILRNGTTQDVTITSVPASSLKGNKANRGNYNELNPNVKEVNIPVSTQHGNVAYKPENIVNNQVYLRVRYAGEQWWLYNKVHKLNSEHKFDPVSLKLNIDYTKTLYIEMVYEYSDGKWYGDYDYITGSQAVWGRGYNKAKLMIWHRFERAQLEPEWKDFLSKEVKVKNWTVGLLLKKEGFDYYDSRGYTFPDTVNVKVIDTHGKMVMDKDLPVQFSNWEDKIWSMPSDLDVTNFSADPQKIEQDMTFLFTINAEKDGEVTPLTFKVREITTFARNNQGMYLSPRRSLTYYFDSNGDLSKLRVY